ncbi:MAG: histidine--tRNA ligase [Lentisphaerae bacterium]|nr:histidine--tRNA ligase [Lentisphaerota bacterium]
MSSEAPTFAAPRGMRDFYPEDMAFRNLLFDTWRRAADMHAFEPYDAPVVESLELLQRKAGEEIVHQIYAFQDKSGRDLALRPEMTPTLARMIAARQGSLAFPLKWYAIAQCFRYERMTRGRKREHFQWNLDIIGEPSLSAEVEVLATAVDALTRLGLGRADVRIHYSSRALLAALLTAFGIATDHHPATFLALDKRGKISDEDIGALLHASGLNDSQCEAVWRLLRLETLEAALAILPPDSPVVADLSLFTRLLAEHEMADMMQFDISIVRGLAYYTGIVFEAFDARRQFRALFGGGRYDNLLASVGGRPTTGVGLGFGDVVIAELLMEWGRMPVDAMRGDLTIGYMQPEQRACATTLALALRRDGRQVDLALACEKPKHFFSRASRRPFRSAIYIGPDDVSRGHARLKDLETRAETEIPLKT